MRTRARAGLLRIFVSLSLVSISGCANLAWERSRIEGRLAYRQERYCDAERSLKEAVSRAEKFGSQDVRLAESVKELGWIYVGAARPELAEPLWTRALAIQEVALPADDRRTADTVYWIAELYRNSQRYPDAERLHRRALAMRERTVDRELPAIAASVNALGLTYLAQGRPREAEALFRRAIRVWDGLYAPPDEAGAKVNLARSLTAVGRNTDALPLYQDAIRTWESDQGWYVRPGFGAASLPSALESYASALRAVGRDADADIALRKAAARQAEIEAARLKRLREMLPQLPPNC